MERVNIVDLLPVDAVPFEDFIDGYFPLNLSLNHLLKRHDFVSAWVVLRVAPMMEIVGLGPFQPVPLHIHEATEGQIDWMAVTVESRGGAARLSGTASWIWNGRSKADRSDLSPQIRLAEPAFIRGIGFVRGTHISNGLGRIRLAMETSDIEISSASALRDNRDSSPFSVTCPLAGTGRIYPMIDPSLEERTSDQFENNSAQTEALVIRDGGSPILRRVLADYLSKPLLSQRT